MSPTGVAHDEDLGSWLAHCLFVERERSAVEPLYAMFYGKSKGYSAEVLNRLCATLQCKPGDLLRWQPDRFPRLKKRLTN
jgi:Cro/C1-type HTH DNA-binding domain